MTFYVKSYLALLTMSKVWGLGSLGVGAGEIGWNGLGEGLAVMVLVRDPGWGTTGRICKFCCKFCWKDVVPYDEVAIRGWPNELKFTCADGKFEFGEAWTVNGYGFPGGFP